MRIRLAALLVSLSWSLLLLRHGAADPPVSDELDALSARLATSPTDVDARLRRAETLLRMGEAETALDDVREAEVLAPDDGRTALLRAWCLLTLGDAEDALATLDDGAVERAPRPSEALALRARIAMRLGDDLSARRDLDRALETLAEPDLYLLRAEAERRLGLDDGPGLTEGVIRTGSVVLEAALVSSLTRTGQLDAALAVLDHAGLPEARRTLTRARLLGALGRGVEARALAEDAVERTRERARARPTAAHHLELALALALAGDCGGAHEHYDAAATLSPRYAASEHAGLGSVRDAVSRCGGAR